MHIEIRKNGTFYLKNSVYNPATKLPKNTSIYLGSNPVQAKNKLKTLTDDAALLAQIPDAQLYEIEVDKAIKKLKNLLGLQSAGVTRLITEYVQDLLEAKQFILKAREGNIALTGDCLSCRYKNSNFCNHFKHNFVSGNIRYKDGKPLRCIAYEAGPRNLPKGNIKLPRDFR